MTKRQSGLLLGALALLLCIPGALLAQSEVSDRVRAPAPLAGETYLGPHVGYSFIGKFEQIYCPCDTDQNDFLFVGGRLGHFFSDHFALEATGQYFNPDRTRLPEFWELTLGGMYDFTPSIPGWNTYLGFGGGAARPRVFKGKGVGLAYLAAGSEYRFSKLVGMRIELKGQYNFSSSFTEVTPFGSFPVRNPSHIDIQPNIGLLIRFGGRGASRAVEPAPAPGQGPGPARGPGPGPAPSRAPAPPAVAPAPPPPPPPPPAPPASPREPEKPQVPPVAPAPPPPPSPVREPLDFDHGKARISNIVKARLDAVALRMRDNPRSTVTVVGYPDLGKGTRQETLARQRAENVKQYLIERHGIDASRITTEVDMSDSSNRGKAVVVTIKP